MDVCIRPAHGLRGTLRVPGDKSISHRALMLGALASGETVIQNPLLGEDVQSTRRCLEGLGVRVSEQEGALIVHGRGASSFKPPTMPLDCGNSGTTMRLMAGILASQPFRSVLIGDASLSRRPMRRILEPLRAMGARIKTTASGTAPLEIDGTRLSPVTYCSPIASAQVKSCILLAGLFAEGTTSVTEPSLSRDHTERMLPGFGVPIIREGLRVSVTGPATLTACRVDVPGDISSAAFFLVAATILPESSLHIKGVGLNPTRTGIIEALTAMGADIQIQGLHEVNGEPRANLEVQSGKLKGIRIDGPMIPRLIDEIPILAIAATHAEGRTEIRDASELRVKETDRIAAVSDNLRRMGIEVETFEDGLAIEGPQKLRGAEIESYGDHRIAMAFAVAGLAARGHTVIRNAACAVISFPGFFDALKGLLHG